jgi:two-component system, NarL family, nitrate/nitrite response regulator NarL
MIHSYAGGWLIMTDSTFSNVILKEREKAVPTSLVTVLVVEPNEVIRLGLTTMLRELSADYMVMAWRGIPVAPSPVAALAPDIVVLSSSLPLEDIARVEAELADGSAKTLVVLHDGEDFAPPMSSYAFTDGLIMMGDLTTEGLRNTLDKLNDGQMLLPAQLARQILQLPRSAGPAARRPVPVLTQRELQVITLLSKGFSNKQIGPRIGISEHGVKRHVANVLAKLNCSNRAQAVAYALQNGLVSSDSQ